MQITARGCRVESQSWQEKLLMNSRQRAQEEDAYLLYNEHDGSPVLDTPTTLLGSLIVSSMMAMTRNSYHASCERENRESSVEKVNPDRISCLAWERFQSGCRILFVSTKSSQLSHRGFGNKWCSSVSDSYCSLLALVSRFIRFKKFFKVKTTTKNSKLQIGFRMNPFWFYYSKIRLLNTHHSANVTAYLGLDYQLNLTVSLNFGVFGALPVLELSDICCLWSQILLIVISKKILETLLCGTRNISKKNTNLNRKRANVSEYMNNHNEY